MAFSPIIDDLWQATLASARLTALAARDEVEWIDPGSEPPLHDLVVARQVINANTVQNATINAGTNTITYNGLSGNGINVGIHEGGRIDENHPDLNVVQHQGHGAGAHGTHATHVAGIVGATGVQSNTVDADGDGFPDTPFQWRGVAPQAGLIDSSDLIAAGNLLAAIQNSSLDLANHSHVLGIDGSYTARAQTVDQEIRGGTTSGGDTGSSPAQGLLCRQRWGQQRGPARRQPARTLRS